MRYDHIKPILRLVLIAAFPSSLLTMYVMRFSATYLPTDTPFTAGSRVRPMA